MAILVHVRVHADRASLRQYEDVTARTDDLYGRAIEPGQDRYGNNLVRSPERRLPVAEVEHTVDRTEQLVQFMRTEQDRHLHLAAQPCRQLDDHMLVPRVEADERLIEQQYARLAEQC